MYDLHAVVISKNIPLLKAKKLSKDFIKKPVSFYRETNQSYRFRNIPKTKFIKNKFKTKIINPNVSLIFGDLK